MKEFKFMQQVAKYLKQIFCGVILIFLLFESLSAQQWGDTTYDTRVKNPAYTGVSHPKILFDEAHFNFHTPGGRYRPFANILKNDGYIITSNKNKITAEVLKGYDVFICVNAFGANPDSSTRAQQRNPIFNKEECEVLKQWVTDGGSFLLVADHDPCGSAVENLSNTFGVAMSKNYTGDAKNFDRIALDVSWIRFSVENKNLGNHPIIKGRNEEERVKSILSFTGQSLKGPKNSVPILKLSDEAYDILNFTDIMKATTVPAKGRCQGLAMECGKGRVIVWGEAAMLTAQNRNFGLNYPGTDNKQLVLNIAHWLTRLL